MNITDTHVHVWDLAQYPYSWTNAVPPLNRSFLFPEYEDATRSTKISKVLLVEADVDEPHMAAEAEYLLMLANQNPCIAGVVASGRPENEGFEAYIQKIVGNPKLKGIRRVLHTQPDGVGKSAVFVDNIRGLAKHGLSFDICVLDRQLPIAIGLAEQCPEVSLILDHCGCPQPKGKDYEVWSQQIERIAKFQNVSCKISGLVGYTGHEDWTVEHVRLRVDWVVRCFGWDRLMFGSDWPVCTLSTNPGEWADVVCSLVQSQSESNRSKLFWENAERIYRL